MGSQKGSATVTAVGSGGDGAAAAAAAPAAGSARDREVLQAITDSVEDPESFITYEEFNRTVRELLMPEDVTSKKMHEFFESFGPDEHQHLSKASFVAAAAQIKFAEQQILEAEDKKREKARRKSLAPAAGSAGGKRRRSTLTPQGAAGGARRRSSALKRASRAPKRKSTLGTKRGSKKLAVPSAAKK